MLIKNVKDEPKCGDIFKFSIIDRDGEKIWRFPSVEHCPLNDCWIKFATRDIAIKHFRQIHSDSVVWCFHCKRLLLTKSKTVIMEHYKQHLHNELGSSSNSNKTVSLCNRKFYQSIFSKLRVIF